LILKGVPFREEANIAFFPDEKQAENIPIERKLRAVLSYT
jgi:hypothetical protein